MVAPRASISRSRQRLPSRTGTLPVVIALVTLGLFALVFVFSPTLNPADLLAGRFLEVPVPKVTGLTQDRALIELERGRLHGDVHFVYSSTVQRGKVVRQKPLAASSMRRDSTADIYVSRGPEFVPLPELVGQKRSDVISTIRELGLEVAEERVNDETAPAGDVISQSPAPGTVVEGGATVSISVSTGPMTRTVPEVTGLPIEGAAFNLGKAGFQLGTITIGDNPTVKKGSVVGTDPPAGTVLPRDTAVNMVISSGPPPVALPKVTGLKRADATAELSKLGLIIGEVTQTGAVADPLDGVVLSQSPDPGTELRAGDVVTVTVRRAAVPPPTLPPTTVPPAVPATPGPGQ
ncbi:MAG: PASTA domain-containing protein [Microthrixaceae bacterium]